MTRHGSDRSAVVLFAVLFLVVLAGLSASSMLGAVASDRASVMREIDEMRLRDAARSALLVWADEIASQRDDLLEGGAPELTESITIDNGDDAPPAVVRLSRRPAPDGASESIVTPEAARLDLNHATPEMLAALPGVGAALARRLVEHRASGPFLSHVEALVVGGATAIQADDGGDLGGIGGVDSPEQDTPPLVDLLTVFAVDVPQQIGLAGDAFRGSPRVNINAPWSDNIERAFEQRLDEAVAEIATGLFIDSPKISTPGDLVRLLDRQGVEREQWPALLDSLRTSADPFRTGVVDINAAPRAVLAALPGLDDSTAGDLIATRERLDADALRRITWPLDEGLIDVEAFALLADVAVTRCLQWRIVLRVSFEQPDDPQSDTPESLLPQADEFGVALDTDDETETGPFMEFEAVFDAAGDRVRLAYLRERTALQAALAVRTLPAFEQEPGLQDGPAFGLDDRDTLPADDLAAGDDDAQDSDAREMSLDDLTASYFEDEPIEPGTPGEPDAAGASGAGGDTSGPGGDNRIGRWAPWRSGSRGGRR